MWGQFSVYSDSVSVALVRAKIDQQLRQKYDELIIQMENSPKTPPINYVLPTSPIRYSNNASSASIHNNYYSSRPRLDNNTPMHDNVQLSVDHLRRFWTAPVVVSREEWLQWLSTLRTQILRQSPSFALRTCAPLAEINANLAK